MCMWRRVKKAGCGVKRGGGKDAVREEKKQRKENE